MWCIYKLQNLGYFVTDFSPFSISWNLEIVGLLYVEVLGYETVKSTSCCVHFIPFVLMSGKSGFSWFFKKVYIFVGFEVFHLGLKFWACNWKEHFFWCPFGLVSVLCWFPGVKFSIRAINGTAVDPVAPKKDNWEPSSENWKIKMLYDGDCPLCMREVFENPTIFLRCWTEWWCLLIFWMII